MKIVLFILICFLSLKVHAQNNLVPNYSFEDSVVCPHLNPLISDSLPKPWYIPSNFQSLSFCHKCSQRFNWGVPYNITVDTSFQHPKTGDGYAGFDAIYDNTLPDARDYIQVKLKDSLRIGKCYYCEFWVSLTNPMKGGCNNIAMLLSNKAKYVDTIANPFGFAVIPANPQVFNFKNPIIIDTLNWVKVSAVYVAQGGEQFITIGNFKDDAHTLYKVVNPTGVSKASYYVDDVSVIPLDSMPLKADAGRDTTIKLGDSVFIGSLTNGLTGVVWYNSLGLPISNGIPGFYVTPLLSTFYVIEQTVCGYYSRDTVYINVNPLPVTIFNYALRQAQGDNRQAQDDRVVNYWTTATEINVSHFNVQRSQTPVGSINGKDFTTIGKVAANNKPSEYRFTDDHLPLTAGEVTLYYRLEIVDKDGSKTYSTIQHVNLSTHQELRISPNPARDRITVSAKNIQQIYIINSMGQVVLNREIPRQAPRDDMQVLNIRQLNKGLYLVQVISTNGEMKTEKLIVR